MKVGQIVVVNGAAPARFKNLKRGTLWKVLEVSFGGGLVVGDQNHPRIRTVSAYFTPLDGVTFAELSKLEGTDVAYRLAAIDAFGPATVLDGPAGFGKITVNGETAYVHAYTGQQLAARNAGKVVQRKLAQL